MKTVGEVRQKLKQVRFRHAKRVLEEALSITSSNCEHNTLVDVPGVGEVGVCDVAPTPVVCDAARGCDLASSCGRFSGLHTKDTVKGQVEAALNASIPEVAAKYPDAAALMWVLTEDPAPPDAPALTDPFGESGVFVGAFFGVNVWAGSTHERSVLASSLNALVESEVRLQQEVAHKDEALQSARSELDAMQADLQQVHEKFSATENALSVVEADLKGRVQQLGDALRAVTEERDMLQARVDLPMLSPSRWFK